MPLLTYTPTPPLSEFVHLFWHWDDYYPGHPAERILPTGLMDLTFQFSSTPFVVTDTHTPQIQRIKGPLLAGARTTPFIIDTSYPMTLLSVWFKPGGAMSFLGAPAQELINQHFSLDQFWGHQALFLHEQLGGTEAPLKRFKILEQALLNRLRSAKERHRVVPFSVAQLNLFNPPDIKQIQQSIGLSAPRFIQVFKEEIGLTPKMYARLQRYQRVLDLMARDSGLTLPEVALCCGYFDQSHMNNEFRAFSGFTPSDYAPQSPEHNKNIPVFEWG